VDHGRIEVAGAAGGQLDGRNPLGADPVGVAFGLDVAFDDPDVDLALEGIDGVFEQGGLAGPRTADQVEDDGTDVVEVVPVDPARASLAAKRLAWTSTVRPAAVPCVWTEPSPSWLWL